MDLLLYKLLCTLNYLVINYDKTLHLHIIELFKRNKNVERQTISNKVTYKYF
jgi:hypothetical protein